MNRTDHIAFMDENVSILDEQIKYIGTVLETSGSFQGTEAEEAALKAAKKGLAQARQAFYTASAISAKVKLERETLGECEQQEFAFVGNRLYFTPPWYIQEQQKARVLRNAAERDAADAERAEAEERSREAIEAAKAGQEAKTEPATADAGEEVLPPAAADLPQEVDLVKPTKKRRSARKAR